MKTNLKIETVEELVAYTVANPNNDRRYLLEDRTEQLFVDPAAGQAWEDELSALYTKTQAMRKSDEYRKLSAEGQEALENDFRVEREEILNRRPDKFSKTEYYLRENYGVSKWSSSRHTIDLSEELGRTLDKLWKTRPAWEGSTRTVRTGSVSLAGILKRLGRTDVKNIVEEARSREEARKVEQRRISNLNWVADQAKRLMQEIVKAQAVLGADVVTGKMTVEEIIALEVK